MTATTKDDLTKNVQKHKGLSWTYYENILKTESVKNDIFTENAMTRKTETKLNAMRVVYGIGGIKTSWLT